MIFSITNRQSGKKETREATGDSLLIGRATSCDIVLDSRAVSRRHAEVVRMKNHFYVTDLESGNGTFHNGLKLKPHEKSVLKTGDTIRVEEFDIQVTLPATETSLEENTDSGIIEIKMIKKVLSALDTEKFPILEGVSPPVEGKRVAFTEDILELVMGRDEECTFPIPTSVVSRRHAILHKKWGGVTVTDLKSKNGTFVNGKKITERLLKDGDTITLGNISIAFRNPQEIDMEALRLEYEKPPEEEKPEDEPAVSEEAKLSLDEKPAKEAPREEAEDILDNLDDEEEVDHPPAEPEPSKVSWLSNFSATEIILMGGGVGILILALLTLYFLLT